MDAQKTKKLIEETWNTGGVIKTLEDYIRIPNQSPMFDKEVLTNGLMEKAMKLLMDWVGQQEVKGLSVEVTQEPGRTPVALLTVEASSGRGEDETCFLYGHMDKQPPLSGWTKGGPYEPLIEEGKLYGRGGADDGYAVFTAITAIRALQQQGVALPKIVILIEASEESGSPDLDFYLQNLQSKFGRVGLIVILDSGAGDYERMWLTTSLRGIVAANVKVSVIRNGVHSGLASGIVPSSFRIMRSLLERVEDSATGRVLLPEFHVDIPENRQKQAEHTVELLGDSVWSQFPFVGDMKPNAETNLDRYLGGTWLPQVSYTGVGGIPQMQDAGNVLRPFTEMKLSIRTPPTCDAKAAAEALTKALTENPPYGAQVEVHTHAASGFDANAEAPWLTEAVNKASLEFFGNAGAALACGGSIPFCSTLQQAFPTAQFLATGVLGPNSNAHGPDESFDIEFSKGLTGCVAHIIHAFATK